MAMTALWTAKKAAYRAQHAVMRTAAKVIPLPVPGLLTGPGSVRQLAENLRVRGLDRVLVVTDRTLVELGLLDSMLESFDRRGVTAVVFDQVEPNPSIDSVEAGARAYRDGGCGAIIAFGGGSPIDCAKIVGARVANPFLTVRAMRGLFRLVRPTIPPFFCVPTTAGTGSETTITAVISDTATHEKLVINDPRLVPKLSVLDPELMVGLPPHITAATGMDALTHAVEAFIGINGSPFTDRHAERATRLVLENLERVYADGSDLDARYAMALAAYCGGAAFTRAYVGYVHAIAHNMGGLYGVPHGLANAIILPHVLRFFGSAIDDKLARLAVVGGLAGPGTPAPSAAASFIAHIEGMNARMGIPTTIRELKASDVPLIAERALGEAHPDYPVPVIMTLAECEDLVRGLLAPSEA